MNSGFWRRDAAIAGAVFVAVLLLYIRTASFEFINMDDGFYVPGHETVEKGLTAEGVRYAFTSVSEGNYLPLTWLSHMLVVEVSGREPAGHHVANAIIHALTAALLYVFLIAATGAQGRSLVVTLLWGLHPLRVESVAWVAERKDVLSGLFFMLTLLVYTAYVRRPGVVRYAIVFIVLALGLLAKSMLMVVPCVLLLLDAWPFARVRLDAPDALRRATILVAEKLPLFALSVTAGVVAVWSQGKVGALSSVEHLSLAHRIWNALSSYATYVMQAVWPFGLGVYYPYRDNAALYLWGAAGIAVIVTITGLALWSYKSRPWLAVGWFWFLGMLVPVIGLVQAGAQAHADRYTYLPHLGLLIAAVWTAADLFQRRPQIAQWQTPLAAGLVLACVLITWRQVGFWRTSETLFRHTLNVTGPNHFAEGNYGVALLDQNRPDEAEEHIRRAIAIGPITHLDYHNLGGSYSMRDRPREAKEYLEKALRMNPDYKPSWALLGDVNVALGKPKDAIEAYREAARLGEKSAAFRTNYGIALGMDGRLAEAEAEFRQALAATPHYVPALFNLGVVAASRQHTAEARALFEQALMLQPDYDAARVALAELDAAPP